MTDTMDRFRGCLLGLAVGDALGTTLEFKSRGTFTPITGMTGGGPFNLKPGQWTDDTSMALCLSESLLACRGFDAQDQMTRYWRWYSEGYLSSTGTCFDVGGTNRMALHRFHETGEPFSGSTDPYSAGNGSLMRIAPVPMFFFSEPESVASYAAKSSLTTHPVPECVEACQLFAVILLRALQGRSRASILADFEDIQVNTRKIQSIAAGDYMDKPENEINGSGYVVDCLEAALWCFHTTTSFEEAVLKAANLGNDADTTAAVCGQIAGAWYGAAEIPSSWLEPLYMREEITRTAENLLEMQPDRIRYNE